MEVLQTPELQAAIQQQMTMLSTYWWALILLAVWSIPWKVIALWRSARNGHKVWFAFLMFCNTIGILEIIYIFGFSKKKKK